MGVSISLSGAALISTNFTFMLFNIGKYSTTPEWDEYEIYHDENKEDRIAHGYLLVPVRIKDKLLQEIDKIRKRHNCDSTSRNEIDIRKIETLLRIGLKGGLHYLFDENNKIKITGFYTDGLSWHRPFDKSRICQRLYEQKKDFIDYDPDLGIHPIISDHKDERCTDYN